MSEFSIHTFTMLPVTILKGDEFYFILNWISMLSVSLIVSLGPLDSLSDSFLFSVSLLLD